MADDYGNQDEREAKKALAKAYKDMEREQQIKSLMRQLLEADAYERMMNIKISNNDLYMQLANLIVQLAQSNQVSGRISDKQLISLLGRLTYRPESKIEFKHK